MKFKECLRRSPLILPIKRYLNTNKPLRIAFLSIFLWSTQAVFLSKAYKQVDFSAVLFPAFLSSSLFFLFFKILYDGKGFIEIKKLFPKKIRIILFGVGFYFAYHFFLFRGIQIGPKVETNLVNFLWPLLFVLLGYIFFNKKFLNSKKGKRVTNKIREFFDNGSLEFKSENVECDFLKCIKIIFGFLGICLIITHGHIERINLTFWKGPLLGFVAAICWAVFSIYLKLLGTVSYIASFIGGTTILSGILWVCLDCPNILPVLVISVYLGIFPLGIAMIAWERALKKGRTQEIGTLAFLAPLFSTIFLYLFKVDYINIFSLIGGGLVIIANINFRDIGEKNKTYLANQDKFCISSDLKLKYILRRLHSLLKAIPHKHSSNYFKIIVSYLLITFFLLLKKLHIPILK